MDGESNPTESRQEIKPKDKASQITKVYKALLIGIACGVFFILAAKMVSIAIY